MIRGSGVTLSSTHGPVLQGQDLGAGKKKKNLGNGICPGMCSRRGRRSGLDCCVPQSHVNRLVVGQQLKLYLRQVR